MKWILPFVLLLMASCQKQEISPVAPAEKSGSVGISTEAAKNASIEVVSVRRETLDQTMEAPGKLVWNEDRTVAIGVVATGKVIYVYSNVGDAVEAKQMLARMHTHDVHDTKALLRQARAERDRATSALEQARRTEARMKRLFELKAIAEAQLEQTVLDRKTAEALLRRANADVDKEVQHLEEFLEISADDDESPQHKHDETEELVPVKSTAKGIVIDRKISPGTVVTIGQEAFTITDPTSLWCIAHFPEAALSRIRTGVPVEIDVRAFPGRTFAGRITRLGETIDPNTRTLMVRAELPSQGLLKPEMLATIRLRLPAAPSLVIPESALQVVDGKTVVFVEASAGNFKPRPVEAQVRNGQAMVLSGLVEGERVAANGSYFLKGQLMREAGQ
jgi:cobalt-zinc-cadmium efflux system membrane fusion protein